MSLAQRNPPHLVIVFSATFFLTASGFADEAASLVAQIDRAENPPKLVALGKQALPALLQGLETSDHKDVILHILGEIAASESLPTVLKYTEDPVIEHRMASTYALRKFKTPEAAGRASQLLSDKEERVRSAALQVLRAAYAEADASTVAPTPQPGQTTPPASTPQPPANEMAAVIQLLADPQWALRKEAARLLGDLRASDAVNPLIARLGFKMIPDPEESKKDPEKPPKMIPEYDEPVAAVRMEAIQSLGKIGVAESVSGFIPLLAHGTEAERRAAIDAIERIGGKVANTLFDSVRTPTKEMDVQGPEIRQSAYLTVALARLDDDRSVKPALIYVSLGDSFCQIELIRFLGRRKVAEAAPVFAQMVKNTKVKQVMDALGEALPEIGEPASEAILALLPDRTACVEMMSLMEKPELQNAKAIPQIIKHLEDEDFDIRQAAIKALVAHKAAEAVPSLESARLLDPDERIRDAATDALKVLTGKDYRK